MCETLALDEQSMLACLFHPMPQISITSRRPSWRPPSRSRTLGPGLLENAYLACLCHELTAAGIRFQGQKALPLIYDGVRIECAYRCDLVVEDSVVVEVKALDAVAPIHQRQLRTYAVLADCRVGLLLNFGAPTMRQGIKRVVNGFPET